MIHYYFSMSCAIRKPDFGVSDQVKHKPGCTITDDGNRHEMSDLGRREIVPPMERKQRRSSAVRSLDVSGMGGCPRSYQFRFGAQVILYITNKNVYFLGVGYSTDIYSLV